MKVASHHVALRVADLERSTTFYTDVLGGRVVMEIELDRDFVQSIFGTPPGTEVRNRFIVFDDGALEIFEFVPGQPVPPTDQAAVGLMHFCLWVDDVQGTVARAESAGGRARFPVRPWQGHHFVYIEDPDGHVIELLDATVDECVALVNEGQLPDTESEAG